MPRPPNIPYALKLRPFRGSEAVAAGLLTRRQLERACWRRLFPDIYVYSGVTLDHRALCYAAGLLIGQRGAVSGRSAAFLLGADVLHRDQAVELTVLAELRIRAHPGLVVVRSDLPAGDVIVQGGTRLTTTAFDLCRRGDAEEAVVALDALLGLRGIGVDEVAAFAARRPGWPGCRRIGPVLTLVDTGAESPMESRVRLLLLKAGLPRPVSQFEVFDEHGFFVARLDLAYPERRIGIEYEGDHHRGKGVFRDDLRRLNRLHALGWTVLRFTADDIFRHPGRTAAQVRAALQL